MTWHCVTIRGGSATEREGCARAHAQQFWAVFHALDGSDDAFVVQHWSPLALDLYFSPAAIALGNGLFECAGARPCAAPDPAETCFYAGSDEAAQAWTLRMISTPRTVWRPTESRISA